MIFTETRLKGAYIIAPDRREDERGSFSTLWTDEELVRHGILFNTAQCAVSFNRRKGTLRGLHYQKAPHAQAKLVRCTSGAIYDVIVDLREESATFRQWHAVELTAGNLHTLFIPEGFAHGFVTLQDNTEVSYHLSRLRHPESEAGIRWDDPALGIPWPVSGPILSDRDRILPVMSAISNA